MEQRVLRGAFFDNRQRARAGLVIGRGLIFESNKARDRRRGHRRRGDRRRGHRRRGHRRLEQIRSFLEVSIDGALRHGAVGDFCCRSQQ